MPSELSKPENAKFTYEISVSKNYKKLPFTLPHNMTNPNPLAPKPVSASAIEEYLYKVFPEDLNASNTLFGGKVMAILDIVASIVAERHTHQNCVTAAVNSVHFLNPAKQGDVLICKGSINRAWRTSMEIGVCVLTNHYILGYCHHLVSAYFTFVAVDAHRNPIPVPPVLPETNVQRYRYEEAEYRRLHRQQTISRKSIKDCDKVNNPGHVSST